MNHTPTPWIKYESPLDSWIGNESTGNIICDKPRESTLDMWNCDAQFIVTACNAHEELVAALQDTTARLEAYYGDNYPSVVRAKQVLAKAEKGE